MKNTQNNIIDQNNIIEFVQSNNLRKNLATLILVFIALFLIAKTVLTYKQAVSFENTNNINYISVNGKAEEYVIPDTLTFNITIMEEGKDISTVTSLAKAKAEKAIATLVANGVERENIKLESYYVSDKYENVSQPCMYPTIMEAGMERSIAPCEVSNSKIVGQILTQTMSVKVRDIEKNANNDQRTKIIGELSAQNIKADGFNFTVYDIESVQKNIREQAIKNAKEDAKKLAKDLGVGLDELASFSDNASSIYPMYSGAGYDTMNARSAKAESAPQAPELTPGQEKIVSNVTLTYSIK
jgi:uncharacterized protein YggE